jgi:D-alanine-D-alanine ligase
LKIGVTFNLRVADRVRQVPSSDDPDVPLGMLNLPRDDDDEEFDSPETIQALITALRSLGHDVDWLGCGEPMLERLLGGPRPDLVWNTAEGTGGTRSREAQVPAVLEMLGIPYTGSDPLTLAATLDKDCAKRLVAAAGVATPRWTLYRGDFAACRADVARLAFPLIVKPAFEGSSKGILSASVISDPDSLPQALDELNDVYRQPVLIEEFIEGDELTVGLIGNGPPEVLGVMRVLPRQKTATPFVYSLEVKRDWQRLVRYECPAQLSPDDYNAVCRAALTCWDALGCRDLGRFDFRLRGGVPYFLETNPLPGLSPVSGDLVLLSGFMGIDYVELIARILRAATERLSLVCESSLVG